MLNNHCFTIRLRDEDAVARYKEFHRNVWPQIAGPGGALETIGVLKMQIFFCKPLTLCMYVEGDEDFEPVRDFTRANDLDPRVAVWDAIMHGQLLERLPENDGPLNWAPMERVYSYVDERVLAGGRSDA